MKRALVDIDDSIAPFGHRWRQRLAEIAPQLPPWPFDEYGAIDRYVTRPTLDAIILELHHNQLSAGILPGVVELFAWLRANDYAIVIASLRSPLTAKATIDWLQHHQLHFDELHLSSDKTVLFDEEPGIDLVIDDNPHVLAVALERGIPGCALYYPYNAHMECPLFATVDEITAWLAANIS